jgi:hypothetical protein
MALFVRHGMDAKRLAEDLKAVYPEDAGRIESGEIAVSPRMRATLSAAREDFRVRPVEGATFDGIKDVSEAGRTTWAWDVSPLRPGKKLKLHLLVEAVLPAALGTPQEITTLNKEIDVDVTIWWFITHYLEEWKWAISGVLGALVAAFSWWWKNRKSRPDAARLSPVGRSD